MTEYPTAHSAIRNTDGTHLICPGVYVIVSVLLDYLCIHFSASPRFSLVHDRRIVSHWSIEKEVQIVSVSENSPRTRLFGLRELLP
jgi:hypothetical protein